MAILLTLWLAGTVAAQEQEKPQSKDQTSKQGDTASQKAPGERENLGKGVYSVGGDVTAPVATSHPQPGYTEEARRAGIGGTVVLRLVVDAQGNVTDVRVDKSLGKGLDEKAAETVRTWKFKPGTRAGVPVPVIVTAEIVFRMY